VSKSVQCLGCGRYEISSLLAGLMLHERAAQIRSRIQKSAYNVRISQSVKSSTRPAAENGRPDTSSETFKIKQTKRYSLTPGSCDVSYSN